MKEIKEISFDDVEHFLTVNNMNRTYKTFVEEKKDRKTVTNALSNEFNPLNSLSESKYQSTKDIDDFIQKCRLVLKDTSDFNLEKQKAQLSQSISALGNQINETQKLAESLQNSFGNNDIIYEENPNIKSMMVALVYYINLHHIDLPPNLVEDICNTYQVEKLTDLYDQDSDGGQSDSTSPKPNNEISVSPIPPVKPNTQTKKVLFTENTPTDQASDDSPSEEMLVQYFCKCIQEKEYFQVKSQETKINSDIQIKPPIEYKELLTYPLPLYYHYHSTGFEPVSDFIYTKSQIIIDRYQVVKPIGEAAFSNTVECVDLQENKKPVCLKILKNNKDYIEQGFDEIKVLKELNEDDKDEQFPILRLLTSFYYKEHLFIVTELLGKNLYEFSEYIKKAKTAPQYFTLERLRFVTRQIVLGLKFIHSHNLIHCDLKPENIAIVDPNKATVKIIDLGSACYLNNRLNIYAQSRSYRAPEIILGLPYDAKVDIWSLGCIVAELFMGDLLFDNSSVAGLLASAISLLGPIPPHMFINYQEYSKYFVGDERQIYLYENEEYMFYYPDPITIADKLLINDEDFVSFLTATLQWDPNNRPGAEELLSHPFLKKKDDKSKIPYNMNVVKDAYSKKKIHKQKNKRKSSF